MVMGILLEKSEAFGSQKRDHEIDAKGDGDEKAEKRLNHACLRHSRSRARA